MAKRKKTKRSTTDDRTLNWKFKIRLELLTSLKTADDLRCSGRENNSWSIISTHGVALYLLIYAPPLFVYLTIPGCLFLSGNGSTLQWWINIRENWRDNQERKIHRNWQHCVLDTGRRQQNKTYSTERLKDEQYVTHQNPDEPRCWRRVPSSYKTLVILFIESRRVGRHFAEASKHDINMTWVLKLGHFYITTYDSNMSIYNR